MDDGSKFANLRPEEQERIAREMGVEPTAEIDFSGGTLTALPKHNESLGRSLPPKMLKLVALRAPPDGGEHDGIYDAM